METQIENNLQQHIGLKPFLAIGELIMVFVPAFILIMLTGDWVGTDPMRGFTVVWGANFLILFFIWVGLKMRGESWSTLGLTFNRVKFKEALRMFGLSLLVCIVATVAFLLGGALMMNVSGVPEAADLSVYNYLKDNLGMLFVSLAGVYVVSSFGEEVIYRAFLITRLSQMGNGSKLSIILAVILSSVFFGLVHYTWGAMGMIQTGFMGLAMGISYVLLKKRLWILILAHAYMDTVLLVQMYFATN